MKLQEYLNGIGLSHTAAAAEMEFSRAAVSNWCSGARIPRQDEMRAIYLWSGGLVQPNDFYDLPDLPPIGDDPVAGLPDGHRANGACVHTDTIAVAPGGAEQSCLSKSGVAA